MWFFAIAQAANLPCTQTQKQQANTGKLLALAQRESAEVNMQANARLSQQAQKTLRSSNASIC